jgi:hypothetical protein
LIATDAVGWAMPCAHLCDAVHFSKFEMNKLFN